MQKEITPPKFWWEKTRSQFLAEKTRNTKYKKHRYKKRVGGKVRFWGFCAYSGYGLNCIYNGSKPFEKYRLCRKKRSKYDLPF
jgi:hypothetical protein